MPKRTRSYQSWRLSKLADPLNAASYLNAAIEDSTDMFLKALRNVAQARQMATVARDAGVTRESLYRATSGIGNPTFDTFKSILRALRLKFIIEAEASPYAPETGAPSPMAEASLQTTRLHLTISDMNIERSTQQQSNKRNMSTNKNKAASAESEQIQTSFETAHDFKLIYANFVQSSFSPLDVAFAFGEVMQADQGRQTILTKARVTMTPAEAKLFQGIIADTIRNYEERFGEIAIPPVMIPPPPHSV